MGLTEFFLAAKEQHEGFANSGEPREEPREPAREYMFASILALVVYIILIAFFGKYLWNNYLAKYVSNISAVESPVDIIAISLLLSLLLPRV